MRFVSLLPGGGIHGETGLAIPLAGEEIEADGEQAAALARSGLVKAADVMADAPVLIEPEPDESAWGRRRKVEEREG